MPENPGMSRRKLIGLGAATIATAALPDALLNLSSAAAAATGPTEGIGYFARFGVTEKMLRDGLAAALSRGADYADLFFQHRVSGNLGLEDGAVNRAYTSVELGVGVRAMKGDQTGYAYTEELTT